MKITALLRMFVLLAMMLVSPAFVSAQGSAATGVTRIVKISHRDANELKSILQNHINQSYTSDELSRSAITDDPKTNSLIFRAASDQAVWLVDSLEIVRQLDVPPPQATIAIALVGRANSFSDKATQLERDTATQNEWPGAMALANTRFIAGNEAFLTTPLDAGAAGVLILQARVAIVDPAKKKVLFSQLILMRPDMSASNPNAQITDRDMDGEGSMEMAEANSTASAPGSLRGETLLALNEVILKAGEVQSLGPFPISGTGEQAMLVLKADFSATQ